MKVNVLLPVGLLALALLGVAWLDLSTGNDARSAPPEGTPERNAYIAPTSTPVGQATARPRPTVESVPAPAGAPGTPTERDQLRRIGLLLLVDAAKSYQDDKGDLPSTNGQLQSLCTYKEFDKGCELADYAPNGELPEDPVGNGYNFWYSSDGQTARFYTALEEDLGPDEQPCDTDDAELAKHANVICVSAP